MDAVTYPDPAVKAALGKWVEVRIDIAQRPDVARAFGVVGIPLAIVMDGAGQVFARIPGFKEPGVFVVALQEAQRAMSDR